MPTDPRLLLRGLARFVAVVLVSGLAGAGIGIALAELSANDSTTEPLLPSTSTTAAAAGTTTAAIYRVPRVQVQAAQLGSISQSTGGAPVAIRVRVTNRGSRPLRITTPALVSGDDEVQLDERARSAAGPLLRAIEPGASATGMLRFTLPSSVAERVTEEPAARLRVANRTVSVTLETGEGAG